MIREFRQEDFESVCAIAERAWEPIFSGFERQLGKEVYAVLTRFAQQQGETACRPFETSSRMFLYRGAQGENSSVSLPFTVMRNERSESFQTMRSIPAAARKASDRRCTGRRWNISVKRECFWRRLRQGLMKHMLPHAGLMSVPARSSYRSRNIYDETWKGMTEYGKRLLDSAVCSRLRKTEPLDEARATFSFLLK